MDLVKKTLVGFLIGIGIYGGIIELAGFLFSDNIGSYTLGLVLGLGTSVLLMMHITKTLDKALDFDVEHATKYTRKQALLRLAFMLVVLAVSLVFPYFNFIATVIGMMGLKIASFIAARLLKIIYPDDFVTKPEELDM